MHLVDVLFTLIDVLKRLVVLIVVLLQVLHNLLKRFFDYFILTFVVGFMPKVCDLEVLRKDVILQLIFSDEKLVLHCGLLHLVEIVLELDVNRFLVNKEQTLGQTHLIISVDLCSFLVLII